jgi:ketosteroid isomerase-like protein
MSKKIILKYFKFWNEKKIDSILELMSNEISLRDWILHIKGKRKIKEILLNHFKEFKISKIKLLETAKAKKNFFCKINIKLINKKQTILKVIDIIKIKNGKITSIEAYKL